MKKLALLFLILFYFQNAFSLTVSPQVTQSIAEKIWKNECGGTKEGLTFWMLFLRNRRCFAKVLMGILFDFLTFLIFFQRFLY